MTQPEETAEGTLDVRWENYPDSRVTPKYALLFARYKGFKNGAQQAKRLIGDDALESYLIKINFIPQDAKNWVKLAKEKPSVPITNVLLPTQFLGDFGY
ncbi:MAG TPA: hypothetical protein VGI46_01005 [Candidatus Acidoferrum sp.]|jgi:hypothetical protein